MTEEERKFYKDTYGIDYQKIWTTDDGLYEVGYYVPTDAVDLAKRIYYKFRNNPVAQSDRAQDS